jgi:mRNA interferase MazF
MPRVSGAATSLAVTTARLVAQRETRARHRALADELDGASDLTRIGNAVIAHGDVVWVDSGVPRGSTPVKVRPAVVLQQDWLLATAIQTVLVVPLTSNTALEAFPGNVLVPRETSGLEEDSVANVTQLGAVSREYLDPFPVGRLPAYLIREIGAGVRLVTGV